MPASDLPAFLLSAVGTGRQAPVFTARLHAGLLSAPGAYPRSRTRGRPAHQEKNKVLEGAWGARRPQCTPVITFILSASYENSSPSTANRHDALITRGLRHYPV